MKYVIKYAFFTIIYLILTWIMSDNMQCLFEGNQSCLFDFTIRYLIFMVLMVVYDLWVKDRLFKKSNSK
ncbi:MAG: hypothetical protein LBI72_15700 [Flavobacteriaceae bacterium]|jgi:hypothetical protein|nr:hypothetical protein [Flavobacteriaceae bacterium]